MRCYGVIFLENLLLPYLEHVVFIIMIIDTVNSIFLRTIVGLSLIRYMDGFK